jgi:hypothetical protein
MRTPSRAATSSGRSRTKGNFAVIGIVEISALSRLLVCYVRR